MNALSYRDYHARVEFSADDDLFIGRLAGISDVITFEADTVSGLKDAFHEAVDDYLKTCEEINKDPQKPYSGKVMFRLSPELHSRVSIAAQLQGISLNQWAEKALERAVTSDI